jgi:hypothetical protein
MLRIFPRRISMRTRSTKLVAVSLDDEAPPLSGLTHEKATQFRLRPGMEMYFRLLEQENFGGPTVLDRIDKNRKSLTHSVANVNQVEHRTTALDSDLERVALLFTLSNNFDLLKET